LKLGIGAAGTCRSNISKTIFPDLFSKKRKRGDNNNGEDDIENLQTQKQEWGTLITRTTPLSKKVLAFLWQDNAPVSFLSTIYNPQEFIDRERRCPQKNNTTNNRIARRPFETVFESKKETTWRQTLPIPYFVDDYNNNMNSVDIADQLRRNYKTQ